MLIVDGRVVSAPHDVSWTPASPRRRSAYLRCADRGQILCDAHWLGGRRAPSRQGWREEPRDDGRRCGCV